MTRAKYIYEVRGPVNRGGDWDTVALFTVKCEAVTYAGDAPYDLWRWRDADDADPVRIPPEDW